MKPVPNVLTTQKDDNDFLRFDVELTARETYLIGNIVAQWGALEHEIFHQTLLSFDDPEDDEITLPKEMNNLQFTGVLGLWKSRVIDKAKPGRSRVLQQQYDRIVALKEYRNALVHGMWNWSKTDPRKISVTRIRKKEINTTHFTVEDLADFADRLAAINFKIRCPRGLKELALARAGQGFHVSRIGASLFMGLPLDEDLLQHFPVTDNEPTRTNPGAQQEDTPDLNPVR